LVGKLVSVGGSSVGTGVAVGAGVGISPHPLEKTITKQNARIHSIDFFIRPFLLGKLSRQANTYGFARPVRHNLY
jgi:hypothetical protein